MVARRIDSHNGQLLSLVIAFEKYAICESRPLIKGFLPNGIFGNV